MSSIHILFAFTAGLFIAGTPFIITGSNNNKTNIENEKRDIRQLLKYKHLDIYFSKEAEFLRLRSDLINHIRDDAPIKYIMNTLFEIKMNPFYDNKICSIPMRNLILLDIMNVDELKKDQLDPNTKCLERLGTDKCSKKELLLDMMYALGEY